MSDLLLATGESLLLETGDNLLLEVGLEGVYLQRFTTAWETVSSDLRRCYVNHQGFRPELQETRPGWAEATILDETGSIDQTALDLGMKVRIMRGSHTLITGLVDAITYNPRPTSAHHTVDVSIVGSDALTQTTLRSGLAVTIERLAGGSPYRYLPLDDPADQPYPRDPSRPGEISAQWAGAPRQDEDLSPAAPGGKTYGELTTILAMPVWATTGDWHVSALVRMPELSDAAFVHNILATTSDLAGTDGSLRWNWISSGGITGLIVTQTTAGADPMIFHPMPDDRGIHHIAIEGDIGVGMYLFVDGVLVQTATNGTSTQALTANPVQFFGSATTAPGEVSIAHIVNLPGSGAIGGASVCQALIRAILHGNVHPDAQWDTATQRIEWLIDEAGLTAGEIEDFPTLIRGVRGGDQASEHLRIVAQSVGALAYQTPDGALNFKRPSSTLTYDLSDQYELPLTRRRDRARVFDSCLAKTPSGAGMGYAGSPGRQLDLTVLHLYPSDAQARCQEIVNDSATGRISVDKITVRPALDDRWDDILPIFIGDAIAFEFDGEFLVGWIEGIVHDCGPHESKWTTSLALSPLLENPFILDHATRGNLDEERLG